MIWQIDPTHSHLSFAIRVLSVSTTRGRFHALRGHLHIDEQNPANSWVAASVPAASIDTHNKLRDAHLRSAAFFAVKQYPTITFQSTSVEHAGGQDYQVTGNLSMHGVTRPITFDVAYRGQSTQMGVSDDFGVGRGAAVQLVASSMVTIEIDLEAVQQAVEAREAAVIATAQ